MNCLMSPCRMQQQQQQQRRRSGLKRLFSSSNVLGGANNDESFRTLAQKHAFNRIRIILKEQSFEENEKWLFDGLQQQNPLHFLLPHKPPLGLVELMIHALSGETMSAVPEEFLDSEGRTPLHIAVEHNCSFDVVERLLSGVSLVVPALTKDMQSRYPLHYACFHPASSGRVERDNKLDTILLLLNAFPQAIGMADSTGRTPKDYAIHRALDDRIIRVLQQASMKQEAQENDGLHLAASPRAASRLGGGGRRLTRRHSTSDLTIEVPSQVDGPGTSATLMNSLFGASQYLFRRDSFLYGQHPCYMTEDDMSTLGWDRASTVVPSSASLHLHQQQQQYKSIHDADENKQLLFLSGAKSPPPPKKKSLFVGTPETQESTASFSTPSPQQRSPPLRSKSLAKGRCWID